MGLEPGRVQFRRAPWACYCNGKEAVKESRKFIEVCLLGEQMIIIDNDNVVNCILFPNPHSLNFLCNRIGPHFFTT